MSNRRSRFTKSVARLKEMKMKNVEMNIIYNS